MTRKQYQIILDLYHEFPKDFHLISQDTKTMFYDILYCRRECIDSNPAEYKG